MVFIIAVKFIRDRFCFCHWSKSKNNLSRRHFAGNGYTAVSRNFDGLSYGHATNIA